MTTMSKLPKVPFTIYPNVYTLNELNRKNPIRFGFIGEDGTQLHQDTSCRDIATTVVYGSHNKQAINLYNFEYYEDESPLCTTSTRMSMRFNTARHRKQFVDNLPMMNEMFRKFGIKETTAFRVETAPLTPKKAYFLIIEGDTIWQTNCWKISLYTYLLRVYATKDFFDPIVFHAARNNGDFDASTWSRLSQSYISTRSEERRASETNLEALMLNLDCMEWDGHQEVRHNQGASGFLSLLNGSSSLHVNIRDMFKLPSQKELLCAA